ncbi:MAG: hypothetical protein AB8B51_11980 [Sedimentitalea sp.]
MSFLKSIALGGAVMAVLSAPAVADTLDFNGLGLGDSAATVMIGNATLTSTTPGGFAVLDPGANGICFSNAAQTSCEGDGILAFNDIVENLSFDVSVFDPGDNVTIAAFNGASQVGLLTFNTMAGVADFTASGNITSLVFDDSSTGAGFAYQNFSFDTVVAGVPIPASMPLLAGGLALAGFVARRKKRKA